ncbi:uncharacterized protein LOC111608943 isoform X2 [Xiphophorus maculatus]|nr:uncharacterized protein LOC111608943 isoform X2 [Xiphophorus maculatus]
MKCISLLLFLALLFFSGRIQGSTEILPTGKESDISFPVEKLSENCTVLWLDHLNKTIGTCDPIGKTKLEQRFKGKVRISGPTTLKFLSPQTSDSGLYSAKVIGDKHNDIVIPFNIRFQDPVSPVGLKVISESSCKATCSTDDDEINCIFECDDKSCRLVGGEGSKVTKSGATLSLYQSNGSIICNHSNQVNWTQNKTEIQPCLRSEGSTKQTALIAGVTGLVVAAIIGVCYCKKRNLACFGEQSNSQVL